MENNQTIDHVKVGEIYEFDGRDKKTKKSVTIQFEIVETGWFNNTIKPGVLLYGLKIRLVDDPDKKVHFMSAMSARPAKKVENV